MCRLHGKVGWNVANQSCGTGRPLVPVPSQYIFPFFLMSATSTALRISSRLIPYDLFTLIFREIENYETPRCYYFVTFSLLGPKVHRLLCI
jgi:hypothetical protein